MNATAPATNIKESDKYYTMEVAAPGLKKEWVRVNIDNDGNLNKETVSLEPVEHKYDVATLKELIRAHVEATGSPRGKEILDNFSAFLPKFKKVLPYDYDRMLRVIASVEERGLDGEQAQIEAFYTIHRRNGRKRGF